MGASRMKDEADFDLERFVEMFDTAMTSSDPRVVNALRQLMMMVVLTSPSDQLGHNRHHGPLRRLFDDVYHLNNRLGRLEEELTSMRYKQQWPKQEQDYEQYNMKVAAAQVAQSIDADVMQSISRKINTPGMNLVQPKGLLKK